MLVGRIIVDDGVDHFSHRDLLLDRIEEADELLVAMVLHVAADDGAIEDVEGCEQRGGAVTFVVVRHRPGAARLHRQSRLGAVECLDLAHMGIRGSRSTSLISWESPVVASNPGFEPVCMIRPVSDAASNSHPVAALLSAAPISRLRRARAQEGGTILFFGFLSQAKSRSAHLDPPELMRLWEIEMGRR